ncbi:MAG: D-alanyl-D-alanine carboxypeptidase, partial [Bryobacteraceae bacterium]|nr:D-alanyl-D-alanine carboxypeptidase [Bryobacteraceae bacterium]
ELWIGSLPIGGVDGTLEKRFTKLPLASRIHAKTGSLSHVSALSGYALREDGRALAFSILVNNYNTSASSIRSVMESIALSLLQ